MPIAAPTLSLIQSSLRDLPALVERKPQDAAIRRLILR